MRNMQLRETISTYDPALALRGQTGTFRVRTGGNGEELYLTCENGVITGFHWPEQPETKPFLITKISEPVPANLGITPIHEAA